MGTFRFGEVAKHTKLNRGNAVSKSQFDVRENWRESCSSSLSAKKIEETRKDRCAPKSGIALEAFDFGSNWKHYSSSALTNIRVEGAREAFSVLTSGIELKSRSFLDVGFGQGLTALCAAETGADVDCLDVNPRCAEALESTSRYFLPEVKEGLDLIVGSILSTNDVRQLREKSGTGYDIVHSWGVLHHTGNMEKAFANCAGLVKPGGQLIVAIYNCHWSSPLWKRIKQLYCRLPRAGQKTMIGICVPVIYLAKLLVTRRNPLKKERGMDFLVDIVDWVGGYPYEYATVDEVLDLGTKNGLQMLRVSPATVPTGCNEFVFTKPTEPRVRSEFNE